MKKINFLLLMLIGVVSIASLSSCNPTTDDTNPSMAFSTDVPFISGDAVVTVGSPLQFKITSAQNPNTKKNLQTLVVKSFIDNTPNVDTTITINGQSDVSSFNFTATSDYSTEERFTFTLTDKGAQTAVKVITITTEDAPSTANPINTYSAKLLGSHNNSSEGSAFASTTGMVYTQADAASNSALIDFIYYYGASNQATIAAPNDETVDGSTSSSTGQSQAYTSKNATKFMSTSISASDFTAMTDDAAFPTVTGSSSKMNMLSTGTVFAFETEAGKVGLIHVSDITGTDAGTMTIDVKVQQ